jgi:hypothetical protein
MVRMGLNGSWNGRIRPGDGERRRRGLLQGRRIGGRGVVVSACQVTLASGRGSSVPMGNTIAETLQQVRCDDH